MRRIAFAFLLLAGSAEAGVNQWTVVGPELNVRAMAVSPHDPDVLYAAADDAVARSDDRGATWRVTAVPGLLAPTVIRVADSLPTTLYALGFGVLYRSTSGGTFWTKRDLPSVPFLFDLEVDGTDADGLVMAAVNFCFLGCSGGGVYRSDDGGGSWRRIGLKDQNVWHVALDATASQVVYASTDETLYRTTNGGRSWSDVTPPGANGVHDITVDPVMPATVFAGTGAGVFRSRDSGASWQLVRPSEFGGMLAAPARGLQQVLAAAGGVALSFDQGETWRELSTANSGLTFSSLRQILLGGDVYYMVTDLQTRPGQILAYEIRNPRRRSVR